MCIIKNYGKYYQGKNSRWQRVMEETKEGPEAVAFRLHLSDELEWAPCSLGKSTCEGLGWEVGGHTSTWSPEGCGKGAKFCFPASYLDALPAQPHGTDAQVRCSHQLGYPPLLLCPGDQALLASGKWFPVTLTSPYSESRLRAKGPSLKMMEYWSAKPAPSGGDVYPTRNFPLTEHCQKISRRTHFIHWVLMMCQILRYVLHLNIITQS